MNKTFCIHNCQKEAPNSSWMTSRDSVKQTLQTDITITLSSTRRLHISTNSATVCVQSIISLHLSEHWHWPQQRELLWCGRWMGWTSGVTTEGGGDSCPWVQQASGCKTASPKYLWQRNTKESMIKLADRNELLLFWLQLVYALVTILHSQHFTFGPHAPPKKKSGCRKGCTS